MFYCVCIYLLYYNMTFIMFNHYKQKKPGTNPG